MLELMFVIKSMVLSLAIMLALQVKVGDSSLESRLVGWVQNSAVTDSLRSVSGGAVLAIQNGVGITKDIIAEAVNGTAPTQKAGRSNFEFKRSQKYQEQHPERD